MTAPVTLPLWLLIVILLFAAVTFASHFLFPSVRWFFRKRMERAVAKLNRRLTRPIEPFKLALRYDTIQRLIYDPMVAQAVQKASRTDGIPENVAFEKARRFAREIVPSFSASVYFGFGARLARWLTRKIYRVRLGAGDVSPLDRIDADASVVFVINHRSNMDYVLLMHLISRTGTVSYAVGEWARVWPLSWLVRAMGAYFIRRGTSGQLYRAVLARYVQMTTAEGVTQAFFPEGRLSVTGALQEPRMGLLSYMVQGWQPGGRDVVFVPVALNYDRVLEDTLLVRAGQTGERRFRPSLWSVVRALPLFLWRAVRLKFPPAGTASVGFGATLTLSEFMRDAPDTSVEALGQTLMGRIASAMPLVAVPMVARALLAGARSRPDLERAIAKDLAYAASKTLPLPRRDAADLVQDALTLLAQRRFVTLVGDKVGVVPEVEPLLLYYAATISHHFADAA